MTPLAILISALTLAADTVVLEERIDLFEPSTGAFMGVERTWFGSDGRRLRLEITDAKGALTLSFFVRHDERGRESEAIYFEDGSEEPSREVFTYSDGGRRQTTTYYYEPGVASDRTEVELDGAGREVRKQYYRADGSQYGAEEVLWDDSGNQLGWDFRYVHRDGGASFRYRYDEFDTGGEWVRRVRSRDGAIERIEVRSRIVTSVEPVRTTPVPFAPGRISTYRSETSPSFARDGKTMVFARYDDDWTSKDPFVAYLEEDGWRVEPLAEIGPVYNLAISPNGSTVIYSTRSGEVRTLFRIRRVEDGWSRPEDLSAQHGLTGTYPCLTDGGDIVFFDSDGPSGAGIYTAPRDGDGFGAPVAVYVPTAGAPFDGYMNDAAGTLLVTRCFDDVCLSGPDNGIWEVRLDHSGVREARKLPNVPYAWGVQPVVSLGLLVFTDGEEIMAIPLEVSDLSGSGVENAGSATSDAP